LWGKTTKRRDHNAQTSYSGLPNGYSAFQGGETWNNVSSDSPKADINSYAAALLWDKQRISVIFPRLEGFGLDPY